MTKNVVTVQKTRILFSKFLAAGVVILVTLGIIGHLTFVTVFIDDSDVIATTEALKVVTEPKQLREPVVKGAVVTNGYECADIGISILKKGGNAVDAAIGSLFCEGVAMPQSMGLGGGFLMTIYNRTTGKVSYLDSREVAPFYASEDMYDQDGASSTFGGAAVAVPLELKGYRAAYTKLGGGVPWEDLIEPTINLCENGVYVTKYLAQIFKAVEKSVDPILREIFIDPNTNKAYLEGQFVKRLRLAETLRIISENPNAIYENPIAASLVQEISEWGGIITEEDLSTVSPKWTDPIKTDLIKNHTLYSSNSPGSGAILGFMLNVLNTFRENVSDFNSIATNQLIVESLKFGYGRRTHMGDADFDTDVREFIKEIVTKQYAEEVSYYVSETSTSQDPIFYGAYTALPEDHGTANLVVLAPNGDAVAVTSTINLIFGAGFASNSTGIIFNNEMDDFSSPNKSNFFNIPPSPTNFIAPGKRPLSSMTPSIILDDKGEVVMVVGAAGGTKITSAVMQIILNHLWFGMNITAALDARRMHHQLYPMLISFENKYLEDMDSIKIVEGLSDIGHKYEIATDNGFAAATAISRNPESGEILGAYDERRSGSISYILE